MAVEQERMPFSIERYERMVAEGILTVDDKVELISGEIVEMAPDGVAMSAEHSAAVRELMRILVEGIGAAPPGRRSRTHLAPTRRRHRVGLRGAIGHQP